MFIELEVFNDKNEVVEVMLNSEKITCIYHSKTSSFANVEYVDGEGIDKVMRTATPYDELRAALFKNGNLVKAISIRG